jgi:hypothetical protein
MEIKDLQN